MALRSEKWNIRTDDTKLDISQTKIKEKHMTCKVVISSLHIILQLKAQVEGTYALNLLPRFFRYHENSTKYSSKNVWNKCVKCVFSPNLYCVWIGICLVKYFSLISKKNGFRVLLNDHVATINRKVLCKQYASTENIWTSPNIAWLFWNI